MAAEWNDGPKGYEDHQYLTIYLHKAYGVILMNLALLGSTQVLLVSLTFKDVDLNTGPKYSIVLSMFY